MKHLVFFMKATDMMILFVTALKGLKTIFTAITKATTKVEVFNMFSKVASICT